jgi:hypothetical protein
MEAQCNRELEYGEMLDPQLFYAARWGELYQFFANGNPPLVLQLLLVNTAVLIFFLVRRWRGKTKLRSQTAYYLQGLLIAANATLMFAPQFGPDSGLIMHRLANSPMPHANKDLDSLISSVVGK